MRLVVYTAIFGNYDKLKPPKIINNKIKYVCFTDRKKKVKSWEIKLVRTQNKDLRRENRKYKILAHKYFKNYDYSIYIDGNYKIICDLSKYVKVLLKANDIAVQEHIERNCIYEEAKECIARNFGDKYVILDQIKKYKKEGYPKKNGLSDNSFIIRHHTPEINRLNELWWREVKNYSVRDQISFCYIVNKLGIKYSLIPSQRGKNSQFLKRNHHKKKLFSHFTKKMFELIPKKITVKLNNLKINRRIELLHSIHFI